MPRRWAALVWFPPASRIACSIIDFSQPARSPPCGGNAPWSVDASLGSGLVRDRCSTSRVGPRLHNTARSMTWLDRKSTRLNSSHLVISYAVFCLKKKKLTTQLSLEKALLRYMPPSTTSLSILGLQSSYTHLHTTQYREYFMQRYHDVISSLCCNT